jgi:alpha-galactosidase
MSKLLPFLLLLILIAGCTNKEKAVMIAENSHARISLINSNRCLWEYTIIKTGKTYAFLAPEFEINNKLYTADLKFVTLGEFPVKLKSGVTEYSFEGKFKELPDIKLRTTFRISDNNPIIKFRYELSSQTEHKLTKITGRDQINYFSVSFAGLSKMKEIRFSEFNKKVQSFCLSERVIETRHFSDSICLMGPLFIGSDDENSFLIGYEHGSQVPDKFLQFRLNPDKSVELQAVKGNYYSNYQLNKNQSYQTVWFEAGAVAGDENLLAANYREFMLKYMSQNAETRKPYIFYNTWNFQERNRNWYKKPYLANMTLERMLKEIEVAHQMGIEVFVIDAGWFEKTGDWLPSPERFPDGLKSISRKLKEFDMKLGLWFNPTVAAVSSNMLRNYPECARTINGEKGQPSKVWETEESYGMCLVSPYRDAFANELIRLSKELGVTYFKWDAIGQYDCNDPRHFHGNTSHTPEERMDSYAFELEKSMTYVVEKLIEACPEAIVDFDITEGGRSVGLGFLVSGKYFLINNGPFFFNYDIPFDPVHDQWNVFFYPGPARSWICRTPLTFDKWIPTSLFLTHYLPDDPYDNQSISLASLILGQNGIWGDLPKISQDGINFFGKVTGMYKQVRNDMTETALIRDGEVGGSPEIYEKINPKTGKGAIVIFSSHKGNYQYVSTNIPNRKIWNTEGVEIKFDNEGHAVINASFEKVDAKIIFFGIDN